MKARFWVPALVVALLVVAAIPAVAAGGRAYKTTVSSVGRGDEAIEGKISSPKAACLGHRLVRGEMEGRIALGNVYTDGTGRFSYDVNFENAPPHLHVFVLLKVMAKSLGGGAICEAAQLSTVVR